MLVTTPLTLFALPEREKRSDTLPSAYMHPVLRRAYPTEPSKTWIQNLHELRRVNRTSEEAHHCTHEQIELYVVHRPITAQAVKPQED